MPEQKKRLYIHLSFLTHCTLIVLLHKIRVNLLKAKYFREYHLITDVEQTAVITKMLFFLCENFRSRRWGPSGGSCMRRPGSEDPHRRERNYSDFY